MKQYLSGLTAVHDFSYGFKESLAEPGGRERLAQAVADNPPVEHPVIRTHPETGKNLIFVNKLFTTHIKGIGRNESDAILQFFVRTHRKRTNTPVALTGKPTLLLSGTIELLNTNLSMIFIQLIDC